MILDTLDKTPLSAKAYITPTLITWARQRDQLSPERAAERLAIDPGRLSAWESGMEHPTFRQAQQLAQRLNIPFGYLFLSAPPDEELPLPDLRTVAKQQRQAPSAALRDLVISAIDKQEWYRDYLQSQGAQPLPFVGRYSTQDDPQVIAENIRGELGLDHTLRDSVANPAALFTQLVRRAENIGVLVLRSGTVGSNTHRTLHVDEFRGFAVSDKIAPLIFINSKDTETARLFTIAHELAHVWTATSGISDPGDQLQSAAQVHPLERHANRVAAEVLLPALEFAQKWDSNESPDSQVSDIASSFKVSRLAVLRQALDLDLIRRDAYNKLYGRFSGSPSRKKAEARGGGDFYANLLARNGKTLTATLVAAVGEGRVSYKDASRLLGVSLATLERLANSQPRTAAADVG